MSDLKWIKLAVDIFEDEKIQLIEAQPDADAILLIWIKLLALAGRTNNGGVFVFTKGQPYTAEMLATIFRRPVEAVRSALERFENYGMVEIVEGVITIPKWEKHQNIEGLEKIREQGRQRAQRYRERQKESLEGNVTHNVTVTSSNATDKNRIDKNNYIVEIVSHLNRVCGTHYRSSTGKTQRLIIARINEGFSKEDFFKVIDTKAAQWLDNPKMKKYLRPQTLFGTKFEGYLNEADIGSAGSQSGVTSHAEIEARKKAEGVL